VTDSDPQDGSHRRLQQQLEFLLEADRLKQVLRRTSIIGDHRRENTAEHSWHLALFALVLAEWADEPVDLAKVLTLCLVHDLVEIDAGDTFAYDAEGAHSKTEREAQAARRLFGLLPSDQAATLHALWTEYKAMETPESRFANAVDRLQPVLLNHASGERSPWVLHGVTRSQVVDRNLPIVQGSTALWEVAASKIDEAFQGDVKGS
jgi:putative hydrolase of HD superfamily